MHVGSLREGKVTVQNFSGDIALGIASGTDKTPLRAAEQEARQ